MTLGFLFLSIGIAAALLGLAAVLQSARAEDTPLLQTSFGTVPYRIIHQDQGENLSIIIGLHGFGIDERQMETLVGIKPDFPHIYIAPRGFYQLEDKSYGWFPLTFENAAPVIKAGDLETAIKKLREVVDGLIHQVQADPEQVYLLGYSQGSSTALTYALAYPQTIKAAIAYNGYLTEEMKAFAPQAQSLPPVPVLYGHGTKDTLISKEQVQDTAMFLESLNYPVELKTYPAPHVISAAGRQDIEAFLTKENIL